MSVTPQTLTEVGSGSWHTGYDYKWRYSITGYEIYDLWHPGQSYWLGDSYGSNWFTIKVDTSTNTWSDHGSDQPSTVTEIAGTSPVTVEVSSGTTIHYRFEKPTTASWITSASGPGVLADSDSDSESDSPAAKKVFCNFW